LILYLDSSAIVKLYVEEAGSGEGRSQAVASDVLVSTVLAEVEVLAAFARARRMGSLAVQAAIDVATQFLREWPEYRHVEVTASVVASAGRLAATHGLRAYDAVHLASSIELRTVVGEPVVFATFDRMLWRAARESGLEAWPPDFA